MRRGVGLGLLVVLSSFVAIAACSSDSDGAPDGGSPDGGPAPTDTTTPPPPPPTDHFDPDATAPPSEPSIGEPDTFETSEYDVEEDIDTTDNTKRRVISPLIYGVNSFDVGAIPADALKALTFVRRGGDRVNTYDWETNLSSHSSEQSDQYAYNSYDLLPAAMQGSVAERTKPAALDLDMITRLRTAGLSAMIPFTLNDYVARREGSPDWTSWGLTSTTRTDWFDRNRPVRDGAFPAEPSLGDGAVYADEHFAYLKAKLGNIYAPGAGRVLVGIDNEPDIYHYNYPYLQDGRGEQLRSKNGTVVGRVADGNQFTDEKFLPFAKRVKALDPNAFIIGPDHYHYDGFTTWEEHMTSTYSDEGDGTWFMEGFLDKVKAASDVAGRRLLDIWDFHWYPQYRVNGTECEDIQAAAVASPGAARQAVLDAPREMWDDTFTTNGWYAQSHATNGPTYILRRIKQRIDAHYPGTPIGLSEYWPGGGGTIYNGLAVADMLGIFQRENVALGALWPSGPLDYAYGAFKLLRNADGNGLKFASVYAPVANPAAAATERTERALSSAYAGSEDKTTMTVLVINKTASARRFAIRAKHSALLKTVTPYVLAGTGPNPVAQPAATLAKKNAYLYAAPAYTATLLVFKN